MTGRDPADSVPSLREPRYSQSLERGLAILAWFTAERPVLGVSEIADALGLGRSTAHRYATTLTELGYLDQDARRKYRLGSRVIDLGLSALAATGLREHSRPHLEELRQRTSLTASLAVLDGTDILYIHRLPSFRRGQREPERNLHPGSRLPAYCTAMGKLLLANASEPEQHELLASIKLAKRAPNTITSQTALRQQLHQIRHNGLAVNDQELATGLYAIAAPIRDASLEVVAAVSISTHSSVITLHDMLRTLSPHLKSTAEHISRRLGYHHADKPR